MAHLRNVVGRTRTCASRRLAAKYCGTLRATVTSTGIILSTTRSPRALSRTDMRLRTTVDMTRTIVPTLTSTGTFVAAYGSLTSPTGSEPGSSSSLGAFGRTVAATRTSLSRTGARARVGDMVPVLATTEGACCTGSGPTRDSTCSVVRFIGGPGFRSNVGR